MSKAHVIGVGMTKFNLAGKSKDDWPDYGCAAAAAALKDADVDFSDVQAAVAGYCYGDPTCGQRVVYGLGLSGIPVVNVNNNCSTGSTALFMAREMIAAGHDCVLAVGFEKMERRLSQLYADKGWSTPTERHFERFYADELNPQSVGATRDLAVPRLNKFTDDVLKMFAYAAREHKLKYGTTDKHFAKIAQKNHTHGAANENAAVGHAFDLEDIENAPVLMDPIRMLECTGTADGAAAALVCSERYLRRRPALRRRAVQIAAQSMVTDLPATLEGRSYISLSGFDMAQRAARDVFAATGLSAADVDVVELHDCFSCAELLAYEALGLCEPGGGGALIDSAEWERNSAGGQLCRVGRQRPGGGWVVNPSGGLESKGHPIGATGLGQAYELVRQLRGEGKQRQVDGASIGLQHNFGVGGAIVVTLYRGPTAIGGGGPHAPLKDRTGAVQLSAKAAPSAGPLVSAAVVAPTSLQPPTTTKHEPLPWTWEEIARGWEPDLELDAGARRVSAPGEHDYWLRADEIVGELPHGLRGTLLRNGPGSMQVHGSALTHPIDGDGLVGAFAFTGDGRVHVRSRFVRSRHREAEAAAHKMLYRGQMGSMPPDRSLTSDLKGTAQSFLTGRPSHLRFRNPSNTNVMHWGGKVLTFYETSLPHWLDPDSLGTVGLDNLGGAFNNVPACAAHFHIDASANTVTMLSNLPAMGKRRAQARTHRLRPHIRTSARERSHGTRGFGCARLPTLSHPFGPVAC